MISHKLILKLFLQDPAAVSDAQVVPVFHSWIQSHALSDHLMVDVAEYAHVHHGPGTLLVCREANLVLDRAHGRTGLVYQRKQPFPGAQSLEQALPALFRTALGAARMLEQALPQASFRTDEFLFRIADRLNAPNTPEVFAAVCPALESFARNLVGPVELTRNSDPAALFETTIRGGSGRTLGDLLGRLGE